MEERIQKLREGLAELGCDAFFSLSPPDNQYLTGFRGSTSAVVISADAAHFLCDFRYTEQAGRQVKGCEVHEVSGGLDARVAEYLNELGADSAAFDPTVHTVQQAEGVAKGFEGPLVQNHDLVSGLRVVKSADEIDRIRAASQLAEGVLHDMVADLRAGVTERDVAARMEYEFKRRGAQGASFDPIVLFGAPSSLPHGMPEDRALQPGDMVLIDMGCVLDGYCSDLTRTYVFGTIPAPWFEEIYQITLNAQRAALATVHPGVPCSEVDAAARDIIAEAGYGDQFGHGLGHGVGLEVHEAPRLNKQSDSELVAGMVITIEPGIYLPGKGGVRIEDLVAVTDTGCEVLTTSSKELEVLGGA